MTAPIASQSRPLVATVRPTHLSFSRLHRYLLCPEQYRLYYVERLRPKRQSANLVFGQVLHQALAGHFTRQQDPAAAFQQSWKAFETVDLSYSKRDSWERLDRIGQGLLRKFVDEEAGRLGEVEASEKAFEVRIAGFDLPIVGVIDLVACLDGERTVVDFKTAASGYQDHEVVLSDQLTAYHLAEPSAQAAAFCVLVKTKEPKIEWHRGEKTPEQLTSFLAKAKMLGRQILDGVFYKRPGMWCKWCDYLPVCTGDEKKAQSTLIQLS